jgi:hypothetical protein
MYIDIFWSADDRDARIYMVNKFMVIFEWLSAVLLRSETMGRSSKGHFITSQAADRMVETPTAVAWYIIILRCRPQSGSVRFLANDRPCQKGP